jgi:hypothetical protein
MKKEKVNSRLKNIIEKDRLLLSKDVLELIQFDLYNLLNNIKLPITIIERMLNILNQLNYKNI